MANARVRLEEHREPEESESLAKYLQPARETKGDFIHIHVFESTFSKRSHVTERKRSSWEDGTRKGHERKRDTGTGLHPSSRHVVPDADCHLPAGPGGAPGEPRRLWLASTAPCARPGVGHGASGWRLCRLPRSVHTPCDPQSRLWRALRAARDDRVPGPAQRLRQRRAPRFPATPAPGGPCGCPSRGQ